MCVAARPVGVPSPIAYPPGSGGYGVLELERKLMLFIAVAIVVLVGSMFVKDPEAARAWRPKIRTSERPAAVLPTLSREEIVEKPAAARSEQPAPTPAPSPADFATSYVRVLDPSGKPRAGVPVMWRDGDPLVGASKALGPVATTDADGLASLPRPRGAAVAWAGLLLEEPLSSAIAMDRHETVLKTPPLAPVEVRLVDAQGHPWTGPGDVRVVVAARDPLVDADAAAVSVKESVGGTALFPFVETDTLLSVEASVVGGTVAPKLVVGPTVEGTPLVVRLDVDPTPAVTPDAVVAVPAAAGPAQPVGEAAPGRGLLLPRVKYVGRGAEAPKWPHLVEVVATRKGERTPSAGSRLDPRDTAGLCLSPGTWTLSVRMWRVGAKGWRRVDVAPPSGGWPSVKVADGATSSATVSVSGTALADAVRLLTEAP